MAFAESWIKSTSIHRLNGDRQLGRTGTALYLAVNWLHNHFMPDRVQGDLLIRDFACDISKDDWDSLDVKSSPGRRLSDLFWVKFPWDQLRTELGQVVVFDTGCGSGRYGLKLKRFSHGGVARYMGMDTKARPQWEDLHRQHDFRFVQADVASLEGIVPDDANLFMTQSALEHFDEDLVYFYRLRRVLEKHPRKAVQVHLVPSAACLGLYGAHGVRQYTPRALSTIAHVFAEFSYAVLFRLGGHECIRLHRDFVTRPLRKEGIDLRDSRTAEYEARLLRAVQADMKMPSRIPCFYALVIHSFWDTPIFQEST